MITISDDILIVSATYVNDYVIKISFSDNTTKTIDFYPFITSPNQNPTVKKYLDVRLFKKFGIKRAQDILWNNYEMGFPFETLYTGKF